MKATWTSKFYPSVSRAVVGAAWKGISLLHSQRRGQRRQLSAHAKPCLKWKAVHLTISQRSVLREDNDVEGRLGEIETERLLLLFVPCWFFDALHFVESGCTYELV
jgi:hypothetical protein